MKEGNTEVQKYRLEGRIEGKKKGKQERRKYGSTEV